MPKPTKAELAKYRKLLLHQMAVLNGDVGSMKTEALRATDQDTSVDHLADMGSDNWDQGFLLGLIENEEETIKLIQEAMDRTAGKGDFPYGHCSACAEEVQANKGKRTRKKVEPWIPKARLEYLPWARLCVRHQEEEESRREIA